MSDRFDPKSRRLIAIGCACLAIGLGLRIFLHPVALNQKIVFHVIEGMLLGLALGFNLFGLEMVRRCRADRA